MNLFYPPFCMHCEEKTTSSRFPLCQHCIYSLEKSPPLSPELFRGLRSVCASFSHFEAAQTLLFEFKQSRTPYLAKGMAAWMAIDILKRDFPKPDFLIPIPQTYLKRVSLGLHPSLLLAKELGKILEVPVFSLLKKRWGFPSQEHLSLEKRKHPHPAIFFAKSFPSIENKTILLVDDTIVTGGTLRTAALCLKERFPKAIFGSVFTAQVYCEASKS